MKWVIPLDIAHTLAKGDMNAPIYIGDVHPDYTGPHLTTPELRRAIGPLNALSLKKFPLEKAINLMATKYSNHLLLLISYFKPVT